jgi:hypothetical protein
MQELVLIAVNEIAKVFFWKNRCLLVCKAQVEHINCALWRSSDVLWVIKLNVLLHSQALKWLTVDALSAEDRFLVPAAIERLRENMSAALLF